MRKDFLEEKKELNLQFLKFMINNLPLNKEEEDYFFKNIKNYTDDEIFSIFKDTISNLYADDYEKETYQLLGFYLKVDKINCKKNIFYILNSIDAYDYNNIKKIICNFYIENNLVLEHNKKDFIDYIIKNLDISNNRNENEILNKLLNNLKDKYVFDANNCQKIIDKIIFSNCELSYINYFISLNKNLEYKEIVSINNELIINMLDSINTYDIQKNKELEFKNILFLNDLIKSFELNNATIKNENLYFLKDDIKNIANLTKKIQNKSIEFKNEKLFYITRNLINEFKNYIGKINKNYNLLNLFEPEFSQEIIKNNIEFYEKILLNDSTINKKNNKNINKI